MKEKRFGILECWGAPVSFALAVLVHFLYPWSGYSVWAGLIGAANESVWEHAKILLIPYGLWSIVEFFAVKPPFKRFVAAKTAALFAMPAAMIGFFYLYTHFTGGSALAVDIIATAVWLALGFVLSSALMKSPKTDAWFTASVFALVLLAVMLISFTVNPPQAGIFRDPVTGGFGLFAAVGRS